MDPIDSWVDAAAVRKLAASLVAPSLQAEETPAESYGPAFVGFERSPTPPAAVVPAPAPPSPQPTTAEASPPAKVESQARAALAGARQQAERGGILAPAQAQTPAAQSAPVAEAPEPRVPAPTAQPSPAPEPHIRTEATPQQTKPLASPRGLFMERLRLYGDWLHQSVGVKAFFVADREGELLIDEVHSLKLLQVARTLAHASWAANRQAGGGSPGASLHVKLGAESVLEVLPVSTHYGPLILALVVPGLLPTATVQVVASSLQKAVNTPIQRT